MTLSPLIGHRQHWNRLSKEVDSDQLGHAQLFVGPKHVGKSTLALQLALRLQGVSGVEADRHLSGAEPDTKLYMDEGETLSIQSIREINQRATQSHQGQALVFVIENLERLRPEAMNALLKTLEEPLPGTTFFLTAHDERHVLDTIRSRCQETRFFTVDDESMATAFPGEDELLSLAMGRPGFMKRLQSDEELRTQALDLAQALKDFLEQPSRLKALSLSQRPELEEQRELFLDILLSTARSCLRREGRHLEALDQLQELLSELPQHPHKALTTHRILSSFLP